jgi:hypothetical protein
MPRKGHRAKAGAVTRQAPPLEERLRRLVERELGAEEVTLRPASAEQASDDPCWVVVALPDQRTVAARFASAPEDRAALARRMQILVSAFSHLLDQEKPARARRVPVAHSLRSELVALARRAQGLDAFVIDAHSPVVWGAASGFSEMPADVELSGELDETIRLIDLSRHEILSIESDELATDRQPPTLPPASAAGPEEPGSGSLDLSARAALEVRALAGFARLGRGQPLTHRQRGEGFGYLAHSFAGIYLLVLVFDGVFDELRAERSVHESLPRIERLVLALPPRDPSPNPRANVVRLSPRRR